jgi:hypothetical protein
MGRYPYQSHNSSDLDVRNAEQPEIHQDLEAAMDSSAEAISEYSEADETICWLFP